MEQIIKTTACGCRRPSSSSSTAAPTPSRLYARRGDTRRWPRTSWASGRSQLVPGEGQQLRTWGRTRQPRERRQREKQRQQRQARLLPLPLLPLVLLLLLPTFPGTPPPTAASGPPSSSTRWDPPPRASGPRDRIKQPSSIPRLTPSSRLCATATSRSCRSTSRPGSTRSRRRTRE